jgi:hypothetical protein
MRFATALALASARRMNVSGESARETPEVQSALISVTHWRRTSALAVQGSSGASAAKRKPVSTSVRTSP